MTVSSTTRRVSALMLAVVGAIHLVLTPEYLEEETYVGVLFALGGLFLIGLAVRLWNHDDVPAWLLGAVTMLGMGVGFVLSRTVGLPGFHESEWELSGVVCLVLEVGFAAIAAGALGRGQAPVTSRT